jgi:hypothetical protein
MNGSGHPIDDKYASTRTALKELPLGGLLLDRCPSSGNGLIKMVSWKMYQNGEQELHHLTGHRPNVLYPDSHVDSAKVREIGRKLKEKYSK